MQPENTRLYDQSYINMNVAQQHIQSQYINQMNNCNDALSQQLLIEKIYGSPSLGVTRDHHQLDREAYNYRNHLNTLLNVEGSRHVNNITTPQDRLVSTIEKELNVSPGNKNKRQLISSRDTRQITTLGCDGDKNWLSSFLCFVRSDCVEVFVATNDDIAYRRNSRKIKLGQVGIRCRFCVYLSHQQRSGRSCSFPSSISRIYQSLTMMIREHFPKCRALPHDVKEHYTTLKATTSKGEIESKQYWVDSSKEVGLVDTPNGIILKTN